MIENIFTLNSLIDFIIAAMAVISLIFSIFTYVRTYKYNKIKITIEEYNVLQKFLYGLYVYSNNEIEDYIYDKVSKEYKSISNCIAQIEIYAIGLKGKVYDFDVFYEMAHGYIDLTLRSRIEYIISLKEENSSEEFYSNTKWMLFEMDKRKKSNKISQNS